MWYPFQLIYTNIVKYIEGIEIEERKQYKSKPPLLGKSFTVQLWREYFGYPEDAQWQRTVSPDEVEYMKGKIQEFTNAIDNGTTIPKIDGEPEFVVHQSYLCKNDPCYCGSGKRVIDCCIPEEEFNRIVLEEMRKRQGKMKP